MNSRRMISRLRSSTASSSMPIDIEPAHLLAFKDAGKAEKWRGRNVRRWAMDVGVSQTICALLPDERQTRDQVRVACREKSNNIATCAIVILAWGGMRRDHGRSAWALRDSWLPIVELLRLGKQSRAEAYDSLAQIAGDLMPGIGPAYFTKLLHFLRPVPDALIMDQWTTKSVQLLTSRGRPLLEKNWVSHRNTASDYEWYCCAVEELAVAVHDSPGNVEERLFSIGGRRPGVWRKYVKHHWAQERRNFRD